uniref:C2H2-type domain-containing protein n=1 Tax=Athene cunicularia TaxID=194338 RepID=A0A663NB24_ATHCN
ITDLFTNTFCKVCGAVLKSESQRTSHYKGKKHSQKVRLYIQMHGEKNERQEHSKQKKTDLVDGNKYCNLCSMCFTSPVVALYHYLGKIHAKKLKQLGDQALMPAPQPVSAIGVGYYMCSICKVTLTSVEMYQAHVHGHKHRIK